MSLWMPYAQETALDLSISAIKIERASPVPVGSASHSPHAEAARDLHSPNYAVTSDLHSPHYPAANDLHSPQYATASDLHLPHYAAASDRRSPQYAVASTSHSPPSFYPPYTDAQQYYGYQYQSPMPYAVPEVSSDSPPQSNSPEFFDTESLSDDMEYQAFERDALQAMAEKNGGSLLGNNPRMRRAVQTSQAADDSYRKQRERNNFAAKQSRDRRKLREVRLAFQVTYLKKKMADLRGRLASGTCGRCRQI